MTSDLDAALAGTAPAPQSAVSTVTPRRCRHEWNIPGPRVVWAPLEGGRIVEQSKCLWCGKLWDPALSRRGRTNRSRGNAIERDWAKRMGMRRTGHFGGADDGLSENGLFAGQSKSMSTARFPGWMSDQLERLRLAKPDRIPVLGILEAPGPGHRPRRLVVLTESDWLALHVGGGEP